MGFVISVIVSVIILITHTKFNRSIMLNKLTLQPLYIILIYESLSLLQSIYYVYADCSINIYAVLPIRLV